MHRTKRRHSSKQEEQEYQMSLQEQSKAIGSQLSFAASEAYKLLRANLIFSMTDEKKCKIIGITSALRGEGKSTTAINIAYTIAETEKKVLLMEADMRIPVMAKLLKLENKPGLSHVLAGVNQLAESVMPSGIQENLNVLSAGEIPPNPSELLSSEKMKRILAALSEEYDYIIIDMPPITAVSDGLTIMGLLSGIVIVVRQGYCNQSALAETMRQMKFLNIKILGFVMNCSEKQKGKYKEYGYAHKKRGLPHV